ncbi:MAG: hypothetical protein A2Z04_04750 [Chloroflexi bacterium RBG_16_57_9]|nr:MAG: hypothetical protein A2Z04_04750 [Chloroflexi bacterium RBG_16_57_9]
MSERKVFLSSTFKDLAAYREAVYRAIQRLDVGAVSAWRTSEPGTGRPTSSAARRWPSATCSVELPERELPATRSLNLRDLLKVGPRIVLTGGPGSSKSTVLQHIAWTLAQSLEGDRREQVWVACHNVGNMLQFLEIVYRGQSTQFEQTKGDATMAQVASRRTTARMHQTVEELAAEIRVLSPDELRRLVTLSPTLQKILPPPPDPDEVSPPEGMGLDEWEAMLAEAGFTPTSWALRLAERAAWEAKMARLALPHLPPYLQAEYNALITRQDAGEPLTPEDLAVWDKLLPTLQEHELSIMQVLSEHSEHKTPALA